MNVRFQRRLELKDMQKNKQRNRKLHYVDISREPFRIACTSAPLTLKALFSRRIAWRIELVTCAEVRRCRSSHARIRRLTRVRTAVMFRDNENAPGHAHAPRGHRVPPGPNLREDKPNIRRAWLSRANGAAARRAGTDAHAHPEGASRTPSNAGLRA